MLQNHSKLFKNCSKLAPSRSCSTSRNFFVNLKSKYPSIREKKTAEPAHRMLPVPRNKPKLTNIHQKSPCAKLEFYTEDSILVPNFLA